ncbi:hypothetical protein [Catenulispora rubra]|uniref:hypothetical protein n=1 Tax=Catenulispora rubra TaxID=280293 RepID=UPI001891FA10|nr:hypothetical protein [Catenulispora rubra]
MSGGEPQYAAIARAGLSVEAISAAALPFENYLPLDAVPPDLVVLARLELEHGIPPEHVLVLSPQDADGTGGGTGDGTGHGPGVSALALAGLGVPAVAQPLFLVRSDPLRETMVAALAELVHGSGWAGEDVGLTFLEELSGTTVFELLEWAVPPETGATVVVCDEPLFVDARVPGRFKAVGLRLRRGSGPLRVLGCGEGSPGAGPGRAEHRFSGRGPCDGWLGLHAALAARAVRDGEWVLVHVRGPLREGWLLLEAADTESVRLGGDGGGSAPSCDQEL